MIVIIGAGYAGAATALWLGRHGLGHRVILLEREPETGAHASGRNAGLITSVVDDDITCAMTARGARLLEQEAAPRIACGSVQLSSDESRLSRLAARAQAHGFPASIHPSLEMARRWPLLSGVRAPACLWIRSDATIEPHGLLSHILSRARDEGVRLITRARVEAIDVESGRVAAVRTSAGRFSAELLVNAAGAWAPGVAQLAGAATQTLTVYRRHLFFTGPLPAAAQAPPLPFLWDLDADVYLRAQEGGLMLCPCDHDPHPAEPPSVSHQAATMLAEKLAAAMPEAARLAIASGRACLRTFARDDRYVIGPDPRVAGFFWVAGLGGSGASAGLAAGELAAALLADRPIPEDLLSARSQVDPARFADV